MPSKKKSVRRAVVKHVAKKAKQPAKKRTARFPDMLYVIENNKFFVAATEIGQLQNMWIVKNRARTPVAVYKLQRSGNLEATVNWKSD